MSERVERTVGAERLPSPQRAGTVTRRAVEPSAGVRGVVGPAALPLMRRAAGRELELVAENGDALRLDETLYARAA